MTTSRIAAGAGIVGVLAIAASSALAALVYTGRMGEPYDPLDHWVSELGEVGVSRLAAVFDLGLVVGGVCFAVFMIGMASVRSGHLRLVYGAVGAVAGVAGAFVGIFPMNQLTQHSIAALTFFSLGWIAVGLASLDVVRRPDARFPSWLALIGSITVACFIAFLVTLFADPGLGQVSLAPPDRRPELWVDTVLEWAVIVGILTWTFATAVTWLVADRRIRSGGEPAPA